MYSYNIVSVTYHELKIKFFKFYNKIYHKIKPTKPHASDKGNLYQQIFDMVQESVYKLKRFCAVTYTITASDNDYDKVDFISIFLQKSSNSS